MYSVTENGFEPEDQGYIGKWGTDHDFQTICRRIEKETGGEIDG